MLSKRSLTDALIAALEARTTYPVGDSDAPGGQFGWTDTPSSPGSSFNPYCILVPGSAPDPQGPIADTHADWRVAYTVSSFGASRSQCEWMADLVRSSFLAVKNTQFDGIDSFYKVQQVRVSYIGAVVRSDQVDPPLFGCTDSFTVWISKEL